ncbi:DUF4190 domain-containing protein [Isoptericola rhizosphaerae]|uniref:DUF4190 domain-containing protein n=1 Tax=Isoptericola rhizosphaerae TaxID=3377837 RepID=UPI00383A23E8
MSTPSYDAQGPTGQPAAPPSPYTDHGAPTPYGNQPAAPAPPSGQPPAPGPYGPPQPRPASERSGLAITALVLGIVALLGCWIPFLNIGSAVIGVVGVVLGIIAIVKAARGTGGGKVMAIIGTALSVVAIALSIVISMVTAAFVSSTVEEQTSLIEQSLEDAGIDSEDVDAITSGEATNAGGVVGFDETYTYADGLAVTVTAPEEFTPGEYAVGAEGEGTPVVFEVTIENDTDEVFDPVLMYPIVASGGSESMAVYDDGIDMMPSSKIQPGKSLTFSVAYMVADTGDVQVDLEPGFLEYETLTVTS